MLSLKAINIEDYPKEKEGIFSLVDNIWIREESASQAKHSIERWGTSKTPETGEYFYVIQDAKLIGITGYFVPDLEKGVFGLRHHGTSVKGTGKQSFDLLVNHLKGKYGESFKQMVELIPEGREELVEKFKDWGFRLDPSGVPEWEPKRDYYKYYMVRQERG